MIDVFCLGQMRCTLISVIRLLVHPNRVSKVHRVDDHGVIGFVGDAIQGHVPAFGRDERSLRSLCRSYRTMIAPRREKRRRHTRRRRRGIMCLRRTKRVMTINERFRRDLNGVVLKDDGIFMGRSGRRRRNAGRRHLMIVMQGSRRRERGGGGRGRRHERKRSRRTEGRPLSQQSGDGCGSAFVVVVIVDVADDQVSVVAERIDAAHAGHDLGRRNFGRNGLGGDVGGDVGGDFGGGRNDADVGQRVMMMVMREGMNGVVRMMGGRRRRV